MYKISGSQFLRTTNGIQSGPDAFTESAFKMTFLTILGVTKIYAVSDPVVEGSAGKKISESSRLRVHIKVFSKQFCFIRCRRQHHWAVEQRRYSRLTFVDNTISNSPEVPKVKLLGSDGLFCFSSICKFGSFKKPFGETSITSTG